MSGVVQGVVGWAPAGSGLHEDSFRRRHGLVRLVLLAHVPALAALAVHRGFSPQAVTAGVVPLLLAWAASLTGPRHVRAVVASSGLALASLLAVIWSDGSIEAHFHVFVVIGLVATYQLWPAFVSVLVVTAAGQAVAIVERPASVFEHAAGQRSPWVWFAVHMAFVVTEAMAMMIFWKSTEQEATRATQLATELTNAELVRTREQAEQRRAAADLLTNLSRRNQSLLNRQLARIDQLERNEDDPEALAQLFTLDHLATRMRRNAESLLVLSGEEPPRRFGSPVLLSEVARGAIAEVEDYTRADVALEADALVQGPVVGDLVHLLAELIENAAAFSPPSSRVVISARVIANGGVDVTVTDSGIGMSEAELASANATLAEGPGARVELSGMLGFHVVAKLAARHRLGVTLAPAADEGLVATVAVGPESIVGAPTSLQRTAAPEVPPWQGTVSAVATIPAQGMSTPVVEVPAVPEPVAVAPEPVLLPEVPEPVAVAPEPVLLPEVPEPVAPAPEPVVVQVPSQAPGPDQGVAVTASGLVRRVPQASLNAHLREEEPATATGEDVTESDPERTRSSLEAFYGGLARGMAAADTEGDR